MYAYTAARLAAGVITFEQVGMKLPDSRNPNTLPGSHKRWEQIKRNHCDPGCSIWKYLDQYRNHLFNQLQLDYGNKLHVEIFHGAKKVYTGDMPYSQTFGAVGKGRPLAYLNSLLQLSFALNQGDFAKTYSVGSGSDWHVEVRRAP